MWISIKKKKPRVGMIVDLWTNEGRMTNYVLVKDYGGKKGNDFFEPLECGVDCIRFDGDTSYVQATHWMPLPKPPVE